MALELGDIEALLDAKLRPLDDAIERVERTMEQLVEVQMGLARQDEALKHLRDDVLKCNAAHTEVSTRMREMETGGGEKLWDTVKILLSALISGLLGLTIGKGLGR